MQAVSSTGTDSLTSTSFPIPVVLDSGTTLSYLPQDLAEEIWTEVGAVYNNDVGLAILPCSMANSGGYFSFTFGGSGGATINVTMDELVLDIFSSGSATFSSGKYKGQTACEFGIQNTTSDPFLLGDTFLRSAYVVYDLVNNQVAMAPTNFNATESNIVAFSSSGAPIPSATVAPNQDQISQTAKVTEPAFAALSGFSSTSTSSVSSPKDSSTSSAAPKAVPMDLFRVGLISAAMCIASGMLVL